MAAAAALALTACGGGDSFEDATSGIPVEPFDAPPISEAQKAEFLNAINAVRSQPRTCGVYGDMPAVPPLTWSDVLYKAAYEHSYDMSISGVRQHDGSGTSSDWTAQVLSLGRGSTLTERVAVNGRAYGIWGEDIAWGYGNLSSAINGWLGSDGHCHIIMSNQYNKMGFGQIGDIYTIDLSD